MGATKMRHLSLAAAVLGLSLAASPAMAMFGDPFTPGSSTPSTGYAFPVGESFVASQTVQLNQPGNPNVTAQVIVDVYKETSGTLDFFYQVTNTGNTTLATSAFGNFGFPPAFNTAGGYINSKVPPPADMTQGTFAPVAASDPAGGGAITFSFDSSASSVGLGIGQTSNVMFVSTNATSYDTLGTATVNGDVTSTGANTGGNSYTGIYEPTTFSSVPEPSSLVLCGLAGLIGLGARRFRRAR